MNYYKYIKYKEKYLNLRKQIGGDIVTMVNNSPLSGGVITQKYILLDGTSSSGKSTICNYLKNKNDGYECLIADDFMSKVMNKLMESEDIYTKEGKINFINRTVSDIVMTKAQELNSNKIIIDDVQQSGYIYWLKKDIKNKKSTLNENDLLYIILVYSDLSDIARNLVNRMKNGDPRGVVAFDQFADKYIKSDDQNKNIGEVNRLAFKNILVKDFKNQFTSEENLNNFANNIFKRMDIDDDQNHYIKIRDNYRYNYLLNTKGKTTDDIFKEMDILLTKT